MANRTKFLSRLIGLYCLLTALIMFVQKEAMVEIEKTFVHNPAMLFILGILTLVGGLAMVLAHNQWSGGTLPVAVTLVGWIAVIKGLVLLIPGMTVGLWAYLEYERFYYVYVAISFALGAGLTYGGFRQPPVSYERRDEGRLAA